VKTRWTSRRRVEAALNHQEPDRVPLSMTITEIPYVRLREFLGLPPDPDLRPNRFGEVNPGLDLIKILGFDTISIKLGSPEKNLTPPPAIDGTQYDPWGVGRKRVELEGGAFLLEVTYSPFERLDPEEINLETYPWPDPNDRGFTTGLEERAQNLYNQTDLALIGRFGGTIMEQAIFLRGYEQWMMDLISYPEFSSKLMNRIADIQITLDEAGIKAAGKYLSIFKASGEDLGMQDRPMFSQKTWQEIIRPIIHRRLMAARQSLDRYGADHVKLMLHSDGAIRTFILDLIEDGVEVLDPIQTSAAGMDVNVLKRDFGDDLVFHGAIDTQQVLPSGTPEQVKAEVVRILNALGPGGGLILGPVHNVQPDVPPENLAAMCQAVLDHGRYPL